MTRKAGNASDDRLGTFSDAARSMGAYSTDAHAFVYLPRGASRGGVSTAPGCRSQLRRWQCAVHRWPGIDTLPLAPAPVIR
jgi:hypothetical protein